jgi:hypothetical protein
MRKASSSVQSDRPQLLKLGQAGRPAGKPGATGAGTERRCDKLHAFILTPTVTISSEVVTVNTTCFNVLKLCSLLEHYIYLYHMILTINSDSFPKEQ